jgi:RluA family pseudouridine synthase
MEGKRLKICISKADNGQCIREFLQKRFAISSRCLSALKNKAGGITVNGEKKTVRYILQQGDELCLLLGDGEGDAMPLPPQHLLPFPILAADEWFVAVSKPYDMPTHQSHGHRGDTLADALAAACGTPLVFRAITRLDRDTSGVVLLARNQLAAGFFSRAMAAGEMEKTYYAITHAALPESHGCMVDYIAREEHGIIRRTVVPAGKGDLAVTDYETVEERGGKFLLRLMPRTGRTHQLRIHMSSLGCPLVGDWLYGTEDHSNRV